MSVESLDSRRTRASTVADGISDTFGLVSHDVFRSTMLSILQKVDSRAHGVSPSTGLRVYPVRRGEEPVFVHPNSTKDRTEKAGLLAIGQHAKIKDFSRDITIGVDCEHLGMVFELNGDFSSGPISDQIRRMRQARFVMGAIYARDLIRTEAYTIGSLAPANDEETYARDGQAWRLAAGLALSALAEDDDRYIEDVVAPFRQVLITAEDDRTEEYIYFCTAASRIGVETPSIPRVPAWYYMGMPIIQ